MEKIGNALLKLVEELSESSCTERVKLMINEDLCSATEFEILFRNFVQGTYLERLKLDVETFQTQVKCSCGYASSLENSTDKGHVRCPQCGKFAEVLDDSFRIVEDI